jgi:ketosteroid isomerase-like protein
MTNCGILFSFLLCAVLIVLAGYSTADAQTPNRQTALAEVVAAENGFADRAFESGTRAAFIEFAADDGLVFNRKPENAREIWRKRQANASLLAWRPAWADVSSDGALGYTTGTWAFSRGKTDAPEGWGEYFTIWKKQPDGSWRFLLDLGIGHGKAEVIANSWKSPQITGKIKAKNDSADIWKTLESSFAASIGKKGAKKTYEKSAAAQIRLLREGQMPFQGKTAALAQISDAPLKMNALGGGASADFAYAYGEYELKASAEKIEKGFYARVWKREPKGWRVAAEIFHPIPDRKN